MQKLNADYLIPNKYAKDVLADVKKQCETCIFKYTTPKHPPDTPIISMAFGERVLVDLKCLKGSRQMIVAVCHWSNYCWLGYLPDKTAAGVSQFLKETVFEEKQDENPR